LLTLIKPIDYFCAIFQSKSCLCGCHSFPSLDIRTYCSSSPDIDTSSNYTTPYKLVESELDSLCDDIKTVNILYIYQLIYYTGREMFAPSL